MEKSNCVTLCDPETLCPLKAKRNYPTKSLNHPKWELLDPTPNILKLFKAFNKKYFDGKIKDVAVVWGKLLDEAGATIFRERSRRRDYDCRIILSAPLLRLRPRADLINTLLHEMIHAYLFVTFNEKDRAEHGPEFKKHMRRLNTAAGTAITIYHDFHDEVDLYTKQHWWRCNGPCQKWRPNFGLVRRMRNKPPGPSDRWWEQHSRKCGGTFIKVREPGDMDAKPVKMVTKGAQKKTSPRPRTCRRRAGCALSLEADAQRSRSTSPCPACDEFVDPNLLNEHLDQCLKTERSKDCIVCGSSIVLQDYEVHVISCVDRHFNDAQFKQCVVCSCSIMMKDYEKHISKCSDGDLNTIMDEDNNALKKCIMCDCSIAAKDYEKHIKQCINLTKTFAGKNKTFGDTGKGVLSSRNYDDHVENFNPAHFQQNQGITNCIVCGMHILKEELNIHLEECEGLLKIFENGEETLEGEQNIDGDQCACPICMKIILIDDMNIHIDQCIEK